MVRTAGLVESSHCFTPNIAGFARNSTLTAANRPLPFRAVFWRSSDTHRNLTGRFIVPEGQTPPQSPKTHLSTQATDAKRQSKPSKPDLAVTSFFSLFLKTLLPWQLRGGHIFQETTEIIWNPASAHCMTQVLIYDCPSCTASCSVSPELVGLNVVCPSLRARIHGSPSGFPRRLPVARRHSLLQTRKTRNSQKPPQQTHFRRGTQ